MPRATANRKSSTPHDEAVSDVVGSILLVGLTVGMTVVLAVLLMVYEGPSAAPRADLAVTLAPGAGGWGTGDEEVRVRHLGGPAVPSSSRIVVAVASSSSALTGAALGGPFADGDLTIGETWRHATRIAASDLVTVQVAADAGGSSVLLASLSLVPGGGP